MNFFIEVAEAKKEEEAKKKLTELRDSPRTVDMFMKTFNYKESKFQTICHADFWTSQIMFALNEDGKFGKILLEWPNTFMNSPICLLAQN